MFTTAAHCQLACAGALRGACATVVQSDGADAARGVCDSGKGGFSGRPPRHDVPPPRFPLCRRRRPGAGVGTDISVAIDGSELGPRAARTPL